MGRARARAPPTLGNKVAFTMLKKVALALVVAAPLAAYPALSWMLGKGIESTLAEQYSQLESVPYLKVVQRDYQRGVYRSSDTVTFEVFGDLIKTMQDSGEIAIDKPLRFIVQTDILHGPFPGWKTLAAASSDSRLILDDKLRAELGQLMGDKQPLRVHTLYRFDGGGASSIDSPAFTARLPGEQGGGPTEVDWKGLSLRLEFAPRFSQCALRGEAPGLEMRDGEGMRMVMQGMHVNASQARIFDDEPMFYAGPVELTIDDIKVGEVSGADDLVRIGKVAVTQEIRHAGEFIDFISRIGADTLMFEGDDYGPVHYDISFNHLHGRSVARLYRQAMALHANPAVLNDEVRAGQAMTVMIEPASELLKHDPVISIDRISFMSPQGESRLAARLTTTGLGMEDLGNPMAMMTKVQAQAEVQMPEAFVMLAALSGADQTEDDEGEVEVEGLQPEDVSALLVALGEEGYLVREQGLVKVKADFAQGQLSLNGKPFDPAALGGDASAADE